MNPISPSTNRAIEATISARSASLGKVTRQPSISGGAPQGLTAPSSPGRSEPSQAQIGIRLDSISSEITVTKLGDDRKDKDKDKDLLLIALSQSSLSLNVQLSGGNAGAYTNAAGAVNGPSVGLSVNFSA